MTTLYRPVLIESVEQAEALPGGSMAYLDDTDAYGHPCRLVASKHRGEWWVEDRRDSVVGWTALVPIEAEEETRVTPEALANAAGQVVARAEEVARTYALPPTPLTIQQQTRLVTPWGES